jgi:16S rRNA (cytosine1407-C5)-methyltransferase
VKAPPPPQSGAPVNQAFEDYYAALYGGRWGELRAVLLKPAPPVAFRTNLKAPYLLDRASLLAAESLRIAEPLLLAEAPRREYAAAPGRRAAPERRTTPDEAAEAPLILDACAAPGGKSLALAARLPAGARLLANELSAERRRRLVNVLDAHLEAERRGRVTVSGFDAAALAGRKGERERFCAVLLDAPCSSEAHVLLDRAALAKWTPARPRFLAGRQWALLSAAFLLLKSGGSLVYSTCAITREENDGVAGRLLKKYGDSVTLDPPDFPEGERTEYGKIILPDRDGGIGPMYVARFRKL